MAKKPGNATMKRSGRRKVEVWLEPDAFKALSALAATQNRPVAKLLRRLIHYVNAGGVTACGLLRGVAEDARASKQEEVKPPPKRRAK